MKKFILVLCLALVAVMAFAQGKRGDDRRGNDYSCGPGGNGMWDDGHDGPGPRGGYGMGMGWHNGSASEQAADTIRYLSSMIPHHQAAIDMANAYIAKAKDPTIKQLAQNVVKTQTDEIKTIQALIDKLGKNDTNAADRMTRMMKNMPQSKSSDPDVAFSENMIIHHQLAVVMSTAALQSNNADVRKLARGIINAQTDEIETMESFVNTKQ